ncbi:hypothetical protein GOV04_00805 [Candidatus Woesearchaeota archaeon]|nr:hypothetical protein [Candidatus Woesearchaeota archaeon]
MDVYEKAHEVMYSMLDRLTSYCGLQVPEEFRGGITMKEIEDFYFRYQFNWWQKNHPYLTTDKINEKAEVSTKERLANHRRKAKFETVQEVINRRENDFICEFLAMLLVQELEDEGIDSRVRKLALDHCVILEQNDDWMVLSPGEEWGYKVMKELRMDTSLLVGRRLLGPSPDD